jgi:phenylacetate-CoA ligase
MIDPIGRAVFRAVDLAMGADIAGKLNALLSSERFPAERLRALQLTRLRALLRHAGERVPFYRESFRRHGLDPAALRDLEDLAQLPVLGKSDVLAAGDALLDPSPDERFTWDVTSGSTGSPLRFRRSLPAGAWHRAFGLRGLARFGVRPGDAQARVWGVPIRDDDRRRELRKDWVLNRRRYSSFDLDPLALDAKIAGMANQRPRYVYGYPSAIHEIARRVLERGREVLGGWRPSVVVTTAEFLFDDQRRDIASAFEGPVANEYGASELTVLAFTCPEGGLHLSDEGLVTEFEPTELTIDGKPAFRFVFTDLVNRSMPLIRYRIGDLGRPVEGPCPCGRGLRRIEILGGREVDVLITPDGRRIHGSIFSYLGKSILIAGGVRRFRAVQTARNRLEIQIEKGGTFEPDCLKAMETEVRARAGDGLEIVFVQVPELQPESSGKLRYFVGLDSRSSA